MVRAKFLLESQTRHNLASCLLSCKHALRPQIWCHWYPRADHIWDHIFHWRQPAISAGLPRVQYRQRANHEVVELLVVVLPHILVELVPRASCHPLGQGCCLCVERGTTCRRESLWDDQVQLIHIQASSRPIHPCHPRLHAILARRSSKQSLRRAMAVVYSEAVHRLQMAFTRTWSPNKVIKPQLL